MKLKSICLILFIPFGSSASTLETTAENLTSCIFHYADVNINTSKDSKEISDEAFGHCSDKLVQYRESIGPDEQQWKGLSIEQKKMITKQRDITVTKLKEAMRDQLASYISEKRNSK
ncbi:hypothetical protein [Rosenbergiella nectarea]|uniref:hypothetical protein n=1 Tax=Rosenbergiella nectarea TaxID=988801 RepID=UPI001F4EA6BF|nr:hypothetical protein [Rosenbergiella nectarea]